jgi:sugar (pentulose or hexulose) kinase
MPWVRVCGGGARRDAWLQRLSDELGFPVVRGRTTEASVLGAAMLASRALRSEALPPFHAAATFNPSAR